MDLHAESRDQQHLFSMTLLTISLQAVEQALAIFMLQLSVVVMLPIPFSTQVCSKVARISSLTGLPQLPAICMALIALGIAELDGLFVVAGLLLAVLSEILVFAILRTMTSFLLSVPTIPLLEGKFSRSAGRLSASRRRCRYHQRHPIPTSALSPGGPRPGLSPGIHELLGAR
eukprot:752060-Hanusia_phi.AAC.1